MKSRSIGRIRRRSNARHGGLRLTSYRDESNPATPAPARAGDRVECLARVLPVRNFGNPGNFDYRGYLARQDVELQGTLRSNQLLTIVSPPLHLTISDRLARARGRLLNSIDDLFASAPDEAALARAMLLGDRSFVDHDRVVEFQKTGVYHVLVLAGLHVGALTAFFIWAGRRLRLSLLLRTLLTLSALAAYAGIVEDRPPIVRAVLMAALVPVRAPAVSPHGPAQHRRAFCAWNSRRAPVGNQRREFPLVIFRRGDHRRARRSVDCKFERALSSRTFVI